MSTTQTEFVGGKIDTAINEAVGDIFPTAHVAVAQHNLEQDVWIFDIVVAPIDPIAVPTGTPIGEIIGAAEDAVRLAKLKLLTAWGIDTSDYEGVPA